MWCNIRSRSQWLPSWVAHNQMPSFKGKALGGIEETEDEGSPQLSTLS
jgi:hypothetical protein